MKRVVLAAVAVLLVVSLGGCLGSSSPKSTASDVPTESPTDVRATSDQPHNSSSNATETPPAGARPVANLTADLLNGSAPLRVNFTLADTANSTLAYAWTLVFGDGNATNGTALPALLNHTFALVGNYTVNFTIAAASNQSQASVTIATQSGRVVLQHESGSWTLGASACGIDSIAHPSSLPGSGVLFVQFNIKAGTPGLPFKATFSGVAAPQAYIYISFYDSDGVWISRVSTSSASATVLTGKVGAGAATVVIGTCNAGGGKVVYESGIGI